MNQPKSARICLVICLTVSIIAIGGVLLLFVPVLKVRKSEGYVRSQVSLRQIALALNNYAAVNGGQLPPAVVTGKDGKSLYSWRVLLLPYLETSIEGFHLDEAWNSPHNKQFLEKTPRPYRPALEGDYPPGMTRYQVFVGPGTPFEKPGLSILGFMNHILVVEAAEQVPWSKPADLYVGPTGPLHRLGGYYTKPVHFLGCQLGRIPGFNAVMGDGSLHFITSRVDGGTIRSLISRDDGERFDRSKVD